jgi:hypothetical protein
MAPEQHPHPTSGYLLRPFGWAAPSIAAMMEAEPTLYPALFRMDRTRLHLLALAVAHGSDRSGSLLRLLFEAPPGEVLDAILQRRPVGLLGALNRLPPRVLLSESYRRLVDLLDDRSGAKLICHAETINDATIDLLYGVPGPLRRAVAMASLEFFTKLEGISDGLQFLVSRGAAPSFDALVSDLASVRHPRHLLRRIQNLVETLALPEFIPPAMLPGAYRIDSVAEILRLAKFWKNCLALHVDAVNDGGAAIYYWPDASTPAVCMVLRYGRLGWFLKEAKGQGNAELPSRQLTEIHQAFATAGMRPSFVIRALRRACQAETHREHNRWLSRFENELEADSVDPMPRES